MVRRGVSLLLAASIAGCATPDTPLPVAPHYIRDSDVRLTAQLFGRLAIRKNCLVVLELRPESNRETIGFIPIWQSDSQIGRDARGVYVRNTGSGAIIRPGDALIGGGGLVAQEPPENDANTFDNGSRPVVRDREWLNPQVSPAIPATCTGRYAAFYNVRKLRADEQR